MADGQDGMFEDMKIQDSLLYLFHLPARPPSPFPSPHSRVLLCLESWGTEGHISFGRTPWGWGPCPGQGADRRNLVPSLFRWSHWGPEEGFAHTGSTRILEAYLGQELTFRFVMVRKPGWESEELVLVSNTSVGCLMLSSWLKSLILSVPICQMEVKLPTIQGCEKDQWDAM